MGLVRDGKIIEALRKLGRAKDTKYILKNYVKDRNTLIELARDLYPKVDVSKYTIGDYVYPVALLD